MLIYNSSSWESVLEPDEESEPPEDEPDDEPHDVPLSSSELLSSTSSSSLSVSDSRLESEFVSDERDEQVLDVFTEFSLVFFPSYNKLILPASS